MTIQQRTAARIVKGILTGKWGGGRPAWADDLGRLDIDSEDYDRATKTAEAFIVLLDQPGEPPFPQDEFLVACGLGSPVP